jgi:hypothetical protein
MGGGGGKARSGFWGKTKGRRLIGRACLSARGGSGAGWVESSVHKILSNFIWNLDFWQTLEICTRRFRWNFDMGILPKIF